MRVIIRKQCYKTKDTYHISSTCTERVQLGRMEMVYTFSNDDILYRVLVFDSGRLQHVWDITRPQVSHQTKKIKEVKNGNFQPFYLYYFDGCSGCAGTRRVTWWCCLTLTSSPWPPWRAGASPQSSSSNNTMEWLSSGSVFSSSTLTVLLNLFGNTMREKVMNNNRRSIFNTFFVYVDLICQ